MRVLFDADILVFRCAFAAEYRMWYLKVGEEEHEFRYKKEAVEALDRLVPGQYSRKEGEDYTLWSEPQLEPLGHAIQNLNTLIGHCLSVLGASDFDALMFLSPYGGTNFRYAIAESVPYKGNRDRTHRPTYEKELRDYIVEMWDTRIAVDEEADDLLGIAQTDDPINTVIVSLDKDLDQIPGMKHNFMYDRTYEVTPEQAHTNFHIQLLMGDTSDNIPGLPGIGIGKARKALHGINDPIEQLQEVWRMYQIHSGKDEPFRYLVEQGQLLYIRRQVGDLWQPDGLITDKEEAWNSQELSLY